MGAPAITFACKHGTIRVVGFDKTEGGGWRRREEWTPKDSSRQAVLESSFCASNTDDSFRQDEAGYDSRCACCYLGFAHTEALHRQRLAVYSDACPDCGSAKDRIWPPSCPANHEGA